MSDMWQPMWQALTVALIVAVAALYAVWMLMPSAWQRRLAARLGQTPPSSSCGGCDGCAAPVEPSPPTRQTHPVKVYRKLG